MTSPVGVLFLNRDTTSSVGESPLEKEINEKVFMKELPGLLEHNEGRWVVIINGQVLGVRDTFNAAFEEGFRYYSEGRYKYGKDPMLVKQVSKDYLPENYGRGGRPQSTGWPSLRYSD